MTSEITGFDYRRIAVGDGVELNVAVGGAGRPIVLLHGFPQTHLMWRHVAADLAADHTVICPDLRGYGDSDKPAETGGSVYAKRTMAADVVAVARALGHERFAVAGHDRGAFVAIRAGLDHPAAVTHLASFDVLPLLDTWDVMHGVTAAVGFHLFLMAQPPGLPEAMIAATTDDFFGYFLDAWTRDPAAIPPEIREVYLRSCAAAVPSIVADYRASAGIDLEHDRADRAAGNLLRMPVAVLQQDWGAALGFDAEALWRAWAPDLQHTTVSCGHFMAEESPATVTAALRALLTR
ncbi:alpha/beta fold hydrolase [Nocardia brasiliensis]|uniref:alpha/beta fold hydrolase n=1 Tax=Nocardia brasiliensis TaxID=37326 RepID=UPI002457F3DE|nr:alpha/beta hydrolase [Nocardia brasiliensis]